MELSLIVLRQTVTMFILMGAGWLLYRSRFFSNQGCQEMSRILVTAIIGCVIVRSYTVEFSTEKLWSLLAAACTAFLAQGVSILIAHVLYGKRRRIENFAVSFSNTGFMGIPLVSAVLGDEAVFYVSIYVAFVNVAQQTYGVAVITGNWSYVKPKKVLTNPALLALFIGLTLFFLPVKPPALVMDCVDYIADMNTALAMMILGVYLAQTPVRDMFLGAGLYRASAVRLILVPAATIAVLAVLPFSFNIKITELIAAATPVGSNVAVFAQLHGGDYARATQLVCNSTILSILTLPAVVWAASMIFY